MEGLERRERLTPELEQAHADALTLMRPIDELMQAGELAPEAQARLEALLYG